MKLVKFWIEDFLVLKNLTINFGSPDEPSTLANKDRAYALDFLVGVNGTGKSTVLRLLTMIFKALENRTMHEIRTCFELEYLLRKGEAEQKIVIKHTRADEKWDTEILQNAERLTVFDEKILPERLVILTTGDEIAWQQIIESDTSIASQDNSALSLGQAERDLAELPGYIEKPPPEEEVMQDTPSSRLLLVERAHRAVVTLCGLLSHYTAQTPEQTARGPLEMVLAESRLVGLVGFSLRCRVYSELTDKNQQNIVASLRKYASYVIQQGADQLLVFLCVDDPARLAKQIEQDENLGITLNLYAKLYPLAQPDEYGNRVLQAVNIFLQKQVLTNEVEAAEGAETEAVPKQLPPLHLFDWLSDGEQSFLSRMALLSLLTTPNILVLLDEPEVHFNDYWKRRIVNLLDSVMKHSPIHALITTHSSITLTDVPREDVLILERDQIYTTDQSKSPTIQTFAADPSDIIVHVFGAPHATGQYSVSSVIDYIRQIEDNAQVIKTRTDEIDKLEKSLGDVAPGYWRFRLREQLYRLDPTRRVQ
ncbi:MAG: AAA family ATPase [Anaerolineales bacterium]|nr:AAA family ATPase [Anaerolineales bacterium]